MGIGKYPFLEMRNEKIYYRITNRVQRIALHSGINKQQLTNCVAYLILIEKQDGPHVSIL